MTIEQNVHQFIGKAAEDIGEIEAFNFTVMTVSELSDMKFESPIEQIFYVAMGVYARYHSIELRHKSLAYNSETIEPVSDLLFEPQKLIGKYRVDLALEYIKFDGEKVTVIVELDGHDFHDKDKKQRAYEKARDRYLTRVGYKVLHFTGSELVKDPYLTVLETFVALDIADESAITEYNPSNPFGID